MARIDFYFDVVCPYAYLAHTQIEATCERLGAALTYKPILLGGLFRVIGAGDGPMPGMAASKARLNLLDMHRWAEHWDVPLEMPAEHPRRTVLAMRCVLVAGEKGDAEMVRAAKALFCAYWRAGRDLEDPSVVRAVLDEAGFDGTALVGAASDPDVKADLRRRTDEAAALGAFGVPTFVVSRPGREDELYWGQDRLDLLEERVA